jgi:hypothetical protein
MRSQLIVDRMLVYQASNVLYDERFHRGVNIIHGSNGSGKSTLADFIFFGLGGDLREWKPYASRAEAVMLQITTPQGVLTTRRYVSTDAGRPMDIFFGPLDQALSAGSDPLSRDRIARGDQRRRQQFNHASDPAADLRGSVDADPAHLPCRPVGHMANPAGDRRVARGHWWL